MAQVNRTAGEDVALSSYLTHLLFGDDQGISRETALRQLATLATQDEKFPNLAPLLWNSHGTTLVLVQEIVRIYPELTGQTALANTWERAFNSLGLMRKLALHQETRLQFNQAGIPLLLFPFLNSTRQDRPSHYLRLAALAVINDLLKDGDENILQCLLSTETLPLCLRIMEYGDRQERIWAILILHKFLESSYGLNYVCHTAERFYAVATALAKMIQVQARRGQSSFLVHIFTRLYDDIIGDAGSDESIHAIWKYLDHGLFE
eukprot:Skav218394  [mRNA]  locus=scaffold790:200226:201014:+ [translate_table: standard]